MGNDPYYSSLHEITEGAPRYRSPAYFCPLLMNLSLKKSLAYSLLLLLSCGVVFLSSCRKEKLLTTGGDIRFSIDTLSFDTVFTAQGSAVCSLKIFNQEAQPITLSSVGLEKGNASFFTLNVDGLPGKSVSNIDIAANDSAFVFATVNVDPTAADAPFVIEDKLVATLNGRNFSIPVRAYGQNAYYLRDTVLENSTVFLTNKPYVLLGYTIIDVAKTLTIPAGCKLYMHSDARLFVEGTLKVNGTKTDSVVFQGDRLDRDYFGNEGYPGEWGGIYFTTNSRNNRLNYTILKNCGASTSIGGNFVQGTAIQVDSGADLTLDHSTIMNSIGRGILSFTGIINANNCLFANSGGEMLALLLGGDYTFENCTIVTFGSKKINHQQNAVAAFQNFFKINDATPAVVAPLKCTLRNCVIWGSLENEFFVNKIDGVQADVLLDHCLVRRKEPLQPFIDLLNSNTNGDPRFADVSKDNFRPKAGSSLIDAGTAPTLSSAFSGTDLDGNYRSNGATDVGCYELQ